MSVEQSFDARLEKGRDRRTLDLLCVGEPMVEFNDFGGESWTRGFGGDVSNVAIAAARQGARAGVVTKLGADSFGEDIAGLWRREGVRDLAPRDPARPTGAYFVRHTPQGHQFEYRRAGSAASSIAPSDLPETALKACSILHASGISHAISESSAQTVDAAIAAARGAGALISYDTNLRPNLWPVDKARNVIHGVMPNVDIALPSLDDAQLLCGLDDPEAIIRFYLDLGPSIVALTLGAEGAVVGTREGVFHIPPRKTTLVDASGAGDCFDGAFLAELLESGSPEQAGRYAVTASSLAVEGVGAVAPLPRRADVLAAMDGEDAERPLTLALVAHDKQKPVLAGWVAHYKDDLAPHRIIATGTTSGVIRDFAPGLSVNPMKSGPLGGDQQIGAMIAEGKVDALIFFPDPTTPMPHDVDVKALLRIAILTDTPCAFSRATADLLVASGFLNGKTRRT